MYLMSYLVVMLESQNLLFHPNRTDIKIDSMEGWDDQWSRNHLSDREHRTKELNNSEEKHDSLLSYYNVLMCTNISIRHDGESSITEKESKLCDTSLNAIIALYRHKRTYTCWIFFCVRVNRIQDRNFSPCVMNTDNAVLHLLLLFIAVWLETQDVMICDVQLWGEYPKKYSNLCHSL